jgi:hypothetical protein
MTGIGGKGMVVDAVSGEPVFARPTSGLSLEHVLSVVFEELRMRS